MNETQQTSQVVEQQKSEAGDWKHHFTTVTLLSKTLAMLLFIALPFVGFWLGYTQSRADNPRQIQPIVYTPQLDPFDVGKPPVPPQLPGPMPGDPECGEGPDLIDNLNIGPVDGEGNRLYRNEYFGFEFKYPATFSADGYSKLETCNGKVYTMDITFTKQLEGRTIQIEIAVNGGPLCQMCDAQEVTGLLDGYASVILLGRHYIRTNRENVEYQIRVSELQEKTPCYEFGEETCRISINPDNLDALFESVVGSFNFL
jgi:hypothetical protein